MKYLLLPGTCLIALFISVSVSAQKPVPVNEPDQKKPKLFIELPDKIPVDITVLQSLINTETGKTVSFRLGANATKSFTGQVVSKTEDQSIRSVVIRSGNYNGATLTLSSSAQPNGTVKFTGRIISFQHGDLYELQNQNDQYILVKKNFYDLINE
jgi:hypothetical protein